MTLKMGGTNLSFLRPDRDLPKYLQAVFGQCVAVPRKVGQATVASGSTNIDVADTGVVAGDIIVANVVTQGATAGTFVTAIAITAATKFNIAVNQNPGAGGAVINYAVYRLVP
jgi:hypothetical protein